MQESRLFKILYRLLDKGEATACELAKDFEVSVRTIYRDIDALSAAGIPIYTAAGRNGGIRLLEGFVLNKAVLSEKEKQEILAALQSINAAKNVDGSETLQKLSALFHTHSENWLEVEFSRWGNQESDNRKFERLKDAVLHCKRVKIRYAGSDENETERIIEPLQLAYKAKAWYLKAFCTLKQDYRLFKLNRILGLEVLEEHFVPHEFQGQADTHESDYNLVTLRFPKEMAYRVYDEFDETQIERQENDGFIVSAKMPEDAWLTGFLLSFGTQVEILSPDSLKAILAEQAKNIYEKYKS